ncbi:ulp1 protease family protein [Geopyxis carbonaria]|nr:ulp1 protease family protein [Geopyxis carbonaria]
MPIREAIRDQMSRYSRTDTLGPHESYLSYHDVRLTKNDMACLKSDWINDNNISFWQEYLEREELSRHMGSAVILLRPSMVQAIKMNPNPEELEGALPDLKNSSHIFLPINDCRRVDDMEGGSHWSLLVVSVADRIAFHYDSMSPSNCTEAQIVHSKLQKILGYSMRFADLKDTPQQDNGMDCGVHVCWAMKHLLVRRLLVVERQKEVDMSLAGKKLDAARMRREMHKICEALRKKANRSLSPMQRIKGEGKDYPPRIGND